MDRRFVSLIALGATIMSIGSVEPVHASVSIRPNAVESTLGPIDIVKDIRAGSSGSICGSEMQLRGGHVADGFVFPANDQTNGCELWFTDGTANGTMLLKDIRTGADGSQPNGFTALSDGRLVFQAQDATNGQELWITDGTVTGTTLLKDIDTGTSGGYPNSSSPVNFTALPDGRLVFKAFDNIYGAELWVTDGTVNGTTLVKDINPNTISGSPYGSNPGQFAALPDGRLVFQAEDGTNGNELWVTDGTANGTTLIKDIAPGSIYGSPYSSSPSYFTALPDGRLVFQAYDFASGQELWITDGTANGTTLVKDIWAGASGGYPSSSGPLNFTALPDGRIVFTANNGMIGTELWITDGTANGTTLIKDIAAGSDYSNPWNLTLINGLIYFHAQESLFGREVWVTDGTSSGTRLTANISSAGSAIAWNEGTQFLEFGDSILLRATDGILGDELWTITPNTGGGYTAAILADINPGSGDGMPCNGYMSYCVSAVPAVFVPLNGRVLFWANSGGTGEEVFALTPIPGAPRNPSVTATPHSATVSWLAPIQVGAGISTYTVTSNPGNFTCTTATLSCTVTGLLANQDYTFTVVATSDVGDGPASIPSSRIRTPSPQLGSLLSLLTAVTDIVSDTTLAPGESVTTLYTGFNPNELVLMLMASNPVVIGSANADANGNVAITGNIPANASAGSHTLALYAPVSGFGAKQPITITASGSSSGSGSGIQSPNVDPNTLPATGRGVDLTLGAYLMLIIGLGIVASRRIMAPFVGNHPRRTR
jgi:ELWxxDGT repeat protein